jgi:hypothetical protein
MPLESSILEPHLAMVRLPFPGSESGLNAANLRFQYVPILILFTGLLLSFLPGILTVCSR